MLGSNGTSSLEALSKELKGQESSQRPIDEMIVAMRGSLDSLEETVKFLEDRCKFYMRMDEESADSEPKPAPIKYYNAPILSNLASLLERIRNIGYTLANIANRLV